MADRTLPRVRRVARLAQLERALVKAAADLVRGWLATLRRLLLPAGQPPDLHVLSSSAPQHAWEQQVQETLLPEIKAAFGEEFRAMARTADVGDQHYIEQYMSQVVSRLRIFPASAMEEIRPELLEALAEGESHQQIAERILSALDFEQTGDRSGWAYKAMRIARTEAMGAMNGGALAGAKAYQDASGEAAYKEWIHVSDSRVRASHEKAGGQIVPLVHPFHVGGVPLEHPGDPSGPADEVINCRCVMAILSQEEAVQMGYDPRKLSPAHIAALTASANMDGAIMAMLPADPAAVAHPDGDPAEELHVTLIYLTDDASTLTDAHRQGITDALTQVTGEYPGPVTATVTGVEPFGPQTPAATVLMLDSPELHQLRDALKGALDANDVPVPPEKFATFVPHLTVGYGLDPELLADRVGSTLTLGYAALMAGPDSTAVDLTTGAPEMSTPPPPPAPAAPPITAPPTGPDVVPDPDGDGSDLPIGWTGTLCPLDTPSGDRRVIATLPAGQDPTRPLPLPLLWQPSLQPGHMGAMLAGSIDQAQIAGTALTASGRFDLGGDAGREAARQLHEGYARWVSVGLDDVAVECLPDGTDVAVDWRLMSATMVLEPAFWQGEITPVYATAGEEDPAMAPLDEDTLLSLAASAGLTSLVAGAAPVAPPAAWFEDPKLSSFTTPRADANGRVYGHVAPWEEPHIGYPGVRTTAPRSASGYAHFHTGDVLTAEGNLLAVGHLTAGTGHADGRLTAAAAAAHYDNTGRCVAVVRAGEDAHGIWVAGALVPEATAEQVAELRRSPLSGDWRMKGGQLELVAALCVNVPGFHRPTAGVDSRRQVSLVAAGALAWPDADTPSASLDYARLARAVVQEQQALEQRQRRVQRASMRVGRDVRSRVAAAAARITPPTTGD
ncbi:2'-5' RNA ligase family protein [Streptacidiphilus sp. N1-12]|uniref:2'-5' RNA ligase family protein n=2 Tax=Streptacidiphilus alkalitolerans TaxID=3342712 RepID=A0ABV6V9K0_9ACTN